MIFETLKRVFSKKFIFFLLFLNLFFLFFRYTLIKGENYSTEDSKISFSLADVIGEINGGCKIKIAYGKYYGMDAKLPIENFQCKNHEKLIVSIEENLHDIFNSEKKVIFVRESFKDYGLILFFVTLVLSFLIGSYKLLFLFFFGFFFNLLNEVYTKVTFSYLFSSFVVGLFVVVFFMIEKEIIKHIKKNFIAWFFSFLLFLILSDLTFILLNFLFKNLVSIPIFSFVIFSVLSSFFCLFINFGTGRDKKFLDCFKEVEPRLDRSFSYAIVASLLVLIFQQNRDGYFFWFDIFSNKQILLFLFFFFSILISTVFSALIICVMISRNAIPVISMFDKKAKTIE